MTREILCEPTNICCSIGIICLEVFVVVVNVLDFKSFETNNETDVLLVIQGKSGHPIEDFSQFGGRFAGKRNQREVLFDKGSKFRFDRMEIEDGCPVFYLTEI